MSEGGPPTAPESDIYTVFLAIAVVFVLAAIVVVSVTSQKLFGTWLPFGA